METPRAQTKPGHPDAFARELIEKEIEHLKKRKGTRTEGGQPRAWRNWIIVGVVLLLIGLWGMDTVLFSNNRGDAVHVYLYLHNYGSEKKAQAVAQCGLLTPREVAHLSQREGAFQGYFVNTSAAEARANQLLGFMGQMKALRENRYEALSVLNKVRYILFVKTGLTPPLHWTSLDSSI